MCAHRALLDSMARRRPFVLRGGLAEHDREGLAEDWESFARGCSKKYKTNEGPKTDRIDGGFTHCRGLLALRDIWSSPCRGESGLEDVPSDNPVLDWMRSAYLNLSGVGGAPPQEVHRAAQSSAHRVITSSKYSMATASDGDACMPSSNQAPI